MQQHRRAMRRRRQCALAAAALLLCGAAFAQSGPPGLTAPVTLPAFDPNAPACTPP